MKTSDENQKIDFVVTWVDGNDPAWQEEKMKTLESRRDCSK